MKTVEPIKDVKIIKSMRTFLKGQSTRNELLFIFGINVGLRVSDILNLKFSDVVESPYVVKDYVTIKEQKTGKTKKFYLGDLVKKLIKNYISEIKDFSLDLYVFRSRKGPNKKISRQQAYNILNDAAEKIGIVKRDKDKGHIVSGEIGTHTLRKTFGYFACKNGSSLELLMQIFNHSSQAQTLHYIGLTEEQKKAVYLKSNLG